MSRTKGAKDKQPRKKRVSKPKQTELVIEDCQHRPGIEDATNPAVDPIVVENTEPTL